MLPRFYLSNCIRMLIEAEAHSSRTEVRFARCVCVANVQHATCIMQYSQYACNNSPFATNDFVL